MYITHRKQLSISLMLVTISLIAPRSDSLKYYKLNIPLDLR